MAFEVRTSDFSMPQQGRVDVYVNEVKAFTVETPVMAVVAPMEAGFHVVQAILVDAAGARIGVQSEPVHFLVDYEAETSGAGLASEGAGGAGRGGFVPVETGRVSVIIASHDRYESLMDAIESVKAQTYEDWEIIVVNDASVDSRYYRLIEDALLIRLPVCVCARARACVCARVCGYSKL